MTCIQFRPNPSDMSFHGSQNILKSDNCCCRGICCARGLSKAPDLLMRLAGLGPPHMIYRELHNLRH